MSTGGSRLGRLTGSFTGGEWARLGGFYGVIIALHVAGWGLFLTYGSRLGPAYAGAGGLAYSFGLRHAFDADHISAVDDTTRFLMQKGKKPLGTGFFFSLGHSTVVVALAVAIAASADAVQTPHARASRGSAARSAPLSRARSSSPSPSSTSSSCSA